MKRIPTGVAVAIILIIIGLCAVFRPNGDVGAFIQHPATAAWIQAFGSIFAILAAVWIDRGSARRAAEQEAGRQAAAVGDWTRLSIDTLEVLRETHQFVDNGTAGQAEWLELGRLVTNQKAIADMYLRDRPPSPATGWLLVSLSTYLNSVALAFNELFSKQGDPDAQRSLIETSWKAGEVVWVDFRAGKLDLGKL